MQENVEKMDIDPLNSPSAQLKQSLTVSSVSISTSKQATSPSMIKSSPKNAKFVFSKVEGSEDEGFANVTQKKREIKKMITSDDDDDEDDFKASSSPALIPAASLKSPEIVKHEKDEDLMAKKTIQNGGLKRSNTVVESEEEDDEDDIPLAKKVKQKTHAKKLKGKQIMDISDDDGNDDEYISDEDVPLAKKAKKSKKTTTPKHSKDGGENSKRKRKSKPANSDDDNEPVLARKSAIKLEKETKKKEVDSSPEKADKDGVKKGDENEEDTAYKWWLEANLDDSVKWTTLEHNGVFFPPDYVPHGVKMKYEGKEITLSPPAEEVASFFAALLATPYAENPTFCKNFFDDFLEVLAANDPNCPIKDFAGCDFTPMNMHFEKLKEIKKNMTKEEKEKIKEEKKLIDENFAWATIDGRKEKVGNFRVEPPGLFRGRGDHPRTGKLKKRVFPEDITINIGEDAKIPDAPEGHKWGKIVHDNTVGWLATWTENVNGNTKYVLFGATSSLKGMSDFKKFEKARELKQLIKKIRSTYTAELKDKQMMVRQRATALWLIDRLALRAGNEKGEDEADTVGCCSLRFEHVELEEEEAEVPDLDKPDQKKKISRKMVVFDFLGKDSIRYYNRVEVDPVVWKNLKIFKREPKVEGDPIFDRLNTSSLNKHLNSLMNGLTAKVFRTYNASSTFQEELKKTPDDATIAEKVLAYNRANRQVAILCNHQRSVSKAHGTQMEKMNEKILALKYERYRIRQVCKEQEPKLKKRRPDIAENESDMDEETIRRKHDDFVESEKAKLEKRYLKMLEKARAEGTDEPEKPEFEEKPISDNMEKLEKKFESLTTRILQSKTMLVDKDENKTTALGTSKINYIDPRITVAWCKQHDVPIEKMLTKTLREKFVWAMDTTADWKF